MTTSATLELTDLSRQKRLRVDLGRELLPEHTVEQAIEHYRAELNIPDHGVRWLAFSRGRRLDNKAALGGLAAADTSWTVVPEVAAGASGRRSRQP